MIPKLKKNRFVNYKNGNLMHYLRYALGEIILVVIGILIAININKQYEKSKYLKIKNDIYNTIYDEMVSDTISIHESRASFSSLDSIYNKILNDEMNDEDFMSCEICANIIGMYSPFQLKNKGYYLLSNFDFEGIQINDSLTIDLITFYNQMEELIETINEYSKNDVHENLRFWKEKYVWFHLNHSERIKMREYLDYLKSPDFKNRVAMQQLLVIKNKRSIMDLFNKNAKEILPRLKVKIEN